MSFRLDALLSVAKIVKTRPRRVCTSISIRRQEVIDQVKKILRNDCSIKRITRLYGIEEQHLASFLDGERHDEVIVERLYDFVMANKRRLVTRLDDSSDSYQQPNTNSPVVMTMMTAITTMTTTTMMTTMMTLSLLMSFSLALVTDLTAVSRYHTLIPAHRMTHRMMNVVVMLHSMSSYLSS